MSLKPGFKSRIVREIPAKPRFLYIAKQIWLLRIMNELTEEGFWRASYSSAGRMTPVQ